MWAFCECFEQHNLIYSRTLNHILWAVAWLIWWLFPSEFNFRSQRIPIFSGASFMCYMMYLIWKNLRQRQSETVVLTIHGIYLYGKHKYTQSIFVLITALNISSIIPKEPVAFLRKIVKIFVGVKCKWYNGIQYMKCNIIIHNTFSTFFTSFSTYFVLLCSPTFRPRRFIERMS